MVGVTEPFGDDRHRNALAQQNVRMRMPERMKCQPLADQRFA
jgi:hypothetical protein